MASQTSPQSGSDEEPRHPEQHEGTSPLEWSVAAVSALLVLAVIGFLFYQAVTEPATPPQVSVTAVGIQPAGSGYLVEFEAHNRGNTTAAGLAVEGALMEGAEEVETSETTLSYLPAGARRQGGLFFSEDPRAYRLELRPLGYDRP